MAKNKDNLLKLLEFLDNSILNEPENVWFVDELRKRINSETHKVDNRFDDIYEQCVEQILHQQAENFYKDFSIVSLKPQLLEDFKKMEMWRRRNNLHEFCLAMYQQIECVVNYISKDNTLNEVARVMMGDKVYVDYNNPIVSNRTGSYQIANLLFSSEVGAKSIRLVADQYANDKFRCIYYFVCYKGMMKNNQFENFVEETNIFKDIYGIRNQNHRGNNPDEYEKDREHRIYPYPTVHFFKFLNFLADFMHRINQGFPLSDELVRYSKSISNTVVRPKLDGPKIVDKIELPNDGRKRIK